MSHAIFRKARAAARRLKAMDYWVDLSCHPTSFGNSAYLRVRRSRDEVWIERGFRLSDHPVGEFRQATDDYPTIIYDDSLSVSDLVNRCMISDADLDRRVAEVRAKREREDTQRQAETAVAQQELADRRAAEAAHIERLNAWLADNCPEYASMSQTDRKKVRKRANAEIYGTPPVSPSPQSRP